MTVRAQVTATLVVLVLIGAVDFFARVHVPRSAAERGLDVETALPPGETLSLAEARQRLQSWLPDRAEASAGSAGGGEQQGAAGAAALPDRGELAGRLFVLRGIFDTESGEPFAVLDVSPDGGASVAQHDVTAGESVDGIRVERIGGRQVSLSDGDTVLRLSLFLEPGFESTTADKPND